MMEQEPTKGQMAALLEERGWFPMGDGVYVQDVDLTRATTNFEYYGGYYGTSRPPVFRTPVYADFRLDLDEGVAWRRLYEGDRPDDRDDSEEVDFAGAVGLVVENEGEMPLTCLAEGRGALGLVRAEGPWCCDLFVVRAGEHFVRRDNTGGVEEPGTDANYYRVPEWWARRLLGLDEEEAQSEMTRVAAAMDEIDQERL